MEADHGVRPAMVPKNDQKVGTETDQSVDQPTTSENDGQSAQSGIETDEPFSFAKDNSNVEADHDVRPAIVPKNDGKTSIETTPSSNVAGELDTAENDRFAIFETSGQPVPSGIETDEPLSYV